MNYKVFIGEVFKRMGLLSLCLKIVRKFGYLTKFTDHHAHGIDLTYDMSQDHRIDNIKVVLDVGASIGSMTKYFLEIFPKSIVHSFEPYSVSFNRLRNTFQSNERVVLNQLGLADKQGELKMFILQDSGYNSLKETVNKPSAEMGGKFELVTVMTISDYCRIHGVEHIDFLKIDTEGLDLMVLKGCEEMLKQGRITYIFVECTFNADNEQNTQFEALNEYLQKYNYKVRAIYDQSNFGNKPYLTCVNAMFLLQSGEKN